jgi:hypothetical protein
MSLDSTGISCLGLVVEETASPGETVSAVEDLGIIHESAPEGKDFDEIEHSMNNSK